MTAFKSHDTVDRPTIVHVVGAVVVIDVSVLRYLKLIGILFREASRYRVKKNCISHFYYF